MITSKLTTKARTTIPLPVRQALRLAEGDELAHQIEGSRVFLTKVRPSPAGDPFARFDEWLSQADARAYAGLLRREPQGE
jgi:antitoxin PrlF